VWRTWAEQIRRVVERRQPDIEVRIEGFGYSATHGW
jgi:hypothetical protein